MQKGLFIGLLVLLLSACGGGSSSGSSLLPDSGVRTPSVGTNEDEIYDVYVWKPSALYAGTLYDCALRIYSNTACTLQELPLLGMETTTPTVDDILGRLLVSHAWMGERFEALLRSYPESMLPLFNGLTAIVIDDDIRPAFYTSHTGAIYLDPAYLWTTLEDKRTINVKEDYRSGYSDPLAFRASGRYLKNGTYAFNYGSLTDSSTRQLEDIVWLNASLLLHELAHVNDALPPGSYASLSPSQTVTQAQDSLADGIISDQLSSLYPLQSDVLAGLGQVMYQGATPTDAQKAITATEVGLEFEADSAADTYAYSTQYEDLAMLFEVAMMKYYFGLDYQVYFVTPIGDAYYCDEYQIGWLADNWIGDELVKTRAQLVTSAILPDEDMSLFYQTLPAPEIVTSGDLCTQARAVNGQAKPSREVIPPADFLRRPL